MELVRQHKTSGAVVLDVGNRCGAIAAPIRDLGLSYVALDSDGSSVSDLTNRGFEAVQTDLGDPRHLRSLVEEILAGRTLAAITVLGFLEHVANGPELIESLHGLSRACGHPPLVVSTPNITHIDIAAELLIGRFDPGLLDATYVAFYSPARLHEVMSQAGWVEVGRRDHEVNRSGESLSADVAVLAPGTPLRSLLFGVREQAAEGATVSQFVRCYLAREQPQPGPSQGTATPPFLSVLLRTQGRRASTLVETLLSLAGQTSQDFEVLLLAHDVTADEAEGLKETVEAFDADFVRRIRILRVEGGGRAHPLNVGLNEARGDYIAVLDDDDVAFAHWVEAFQQAASANPGLAVRAVVAVQPIESVPWGEVPGYTARGAAKIPYSVEFDLLEHFFENQTPFCGFAFPRTSYTHMGLRFDESLPVVEDWDLLLRVAMHCGVTSSQEVTSIYRRWQSQHSSYQIHGTDEWKRSGEQVLARLNRQTIALPPGTISELWGLYDDARTCRADAERLAAERDTARDEAKRHVDRIDELLGELHVTRIERNTALDQAERTELEVVRTRETLSWKITGPIRALRSVGRRGPKRASD